MTARDRFVAYETISGVPIFTNNRRRCRRCLEQGTTAVTRIAASAASAQAPRARAVALAARVNGPRVAALALNLGLWSLILLAWRAL